MATAAIETDIWLALKRRIDTLVTNPVMVRFDPGAIVTPPSDASGPSPFILLSDARNDNVRFAIASKPHIRSGTLMLSIQWPISRAVSHAQLVQMGGVIAEHFTADTCMTYGDARLRVQADADVMQPYVDGAYRVVTVRVLWTSY